VRTFIATELPKGIRTEIFSLRHNIPHNSARIKWVKEENIHLTLLFLGEIFEQQLEEVEMACKLVSQRHKKFQMSIKASGVFPNFRRPRVIWVGICQESREHLVSLASDLMRALVSLNLDDRKDFSPHITFGRVKSVYDLHALQRGVESISIETEKYTVKEIILFKSTLKPSGAIYTPLSRFQLQQ